MTELTSPAPSTAGWKEGLDILALARYMKELGATSVGALGISLGGSSVLNACDEEDSATALDGGILAVSPPAVPKLAWERLSRAGAQGPSALPDPPRLRGRPDLPGALRPLAPRGRGHAAGVGARHGAVLRGRRRGDLDPRQGRRPRPEAPRCRCSSSIPRTTRSSRSSTRRCSQQAAKGNDLVRVWILPAGSHGLLEAADPNWTHAVYRTFFERWAPTPSAPLGKPTAQAPSWFTPRKSPGSAIPAEEAKRWRATS